MLHFSLATFVQLLCSSDCLYVVNVHFSVVISVGRFSESKNREWQHQGSKERTAAPAGAVGVPSLTWQGCQDRPNQRRSRRHRRGAVAGAIHLGAVMSVKSVRRGTSATSHVTIGEIMELAGMGTIASTITKEKMLQVVSMAEAVMGKETSRRAAELPVVELKAAVQQAAERQVAGPRTVG